MRQNINHVINDENLLELQAFMLETQWSAEMSLDWFCDRFSCSATDEIIDFVLDAHEAMFADQWTTLKSLRSGMAKPQTISPSSVNSTTRCLARIMRSPTPHLQPVHHSFPTTKWVHYIMKTCCYLSLKRRWQTCKNQAWRPSCQKTLYVNTASGSHGNVLKTPAYDSWHSGTTLVAFPLTLCL